MNYEEAVAYIHSAYWTGTKTGLLRSKELLSLLGNPEKELNFVHVAGTNGKGSFCAMLASILTAAGFKTGLYTSPYIERFNERIALNGRPIADGELVDIIETLKPLVDTMKEKPSEFELITCAAFLYFKQQHCDIVVLEVGMGGEWDSTNVISTPVLSVITAMAFDHMQYLGSTMKDIAAAKAGIIKKGGTTLIYGENAEAEAVFAAACRERSNALYYPEPGRAKLLHRDIHGQDFDYPGYTGLHIPLLGGHQLKNAALVLKAVELLQQKGYAIPQEAVYKGLEQVQWPARMELMGERPVLLIDGGHNPQGVEAAANCLQELFPQKKIRFLIGLMADKAVEEMLSLLLPIAADFITVTPHNPRAMKGEALKTLLVSMGAKAICIDPIERAIPAFLKEAGEEDICCILGSLYLAGDVRKQIREYF